MLVDALDMKAYVAVLPRLLLWRMRVRIRLRIRHAVVCIQQHRRAQLFRRLFHSNSSFRGHHRVILQRNAKAFVHRRRCAGLLVWLFCAACLCFTRRLYHVLQIWTAQACRHSVAVALESRCRCVGSASQVVAASARGAGW